MKLLKCGVALDGAVTHQAANLIKRDGLGEHPFVNASNRDLVAARNLLLCHKDVFLWFLAHMCSNIDWYTLTYNQVFGHSHHREKVSFWVTNCHHKPRYSSKFRCISVYSSRFCLFSYLAETLLRNCCNLLQFKAFRRLTNLRQGWDSNPHAEYFFPREGWKNEFCHHFSPQPTTKRRFRSETPAQIHL